LETGSDLRLRLRFIWRQRWVCRTVFSDQPNPVLTPEVTARLRSPLDNLQKDVVADEFDDRSEQKASASSIAQTAPI
jgi:hypothetical protein